MTVSHAVRLSSSPVHEDFFLSQNFSSWSPTPVTTEAWNLSHQYCSAIVLILSHPLL